MGGGLFDNVTKDMRLYKEEKFGTVLWVTIGLVLGTAAVSAMPPSIITSTAVAVSSLVVVVVLAAPFGLVAGLLPARRASRLDVLDAISTE